MTSRTNRKKRAALAALLGASAALTAKAQGTNPSNVAETNDTVRLPTVTVTAQKIPQDADVVPLSVTPVTRETLVNSGARSVEDAGFYSPNLYFTDFAPRKNSAPRFRGIGASPVNPGVTTYIDGVPQLNSNSSSQELTDIDQIEFIRGPQSTLFGRNTVGGVINLNSLQPSPTWTGGLEGQYGNYNLHDIRGDLSGPILQDSLSFRVGGGYSERDGYTKNVNTGHDVDYRSDWFGKGQLLYNPAQDWSLRLILSGERDRDGDYPLAELNTLREHPHEVNFAYEGYANRDIFSPTLQLTHEGGPVDFTSTTAGVWWNTYDSTDIDYAGYLRSLYALGIPNVPNGLPHFNKEDDFQFTQEFRLASSKDAPISFGQNTQLKWQTGLLVFTQDYKQDTGEPTIFSDREAQLNEVGVGAYGQGTLTFFEKLDLIGGVRLDYEKWDADYNYFGQGTASPSQDFTEASPQAAIAYHFLPKQTIYGEITRGYKAGGFNNATAPSLSSAETSFGKEYSLNYEAGYKGSFLDDRFKVHAAAFYTDWSRLQLNHLGVGGQNFIANVGGADSKGLELELSARPVRWLEIFGSAGYTDARFLSDASDAGVSIAGNRVPYAPDYTVSGGAELTYEVCKAVTAYIRGEAALYGGFVYDSANAASQDSYSIANFRGGLRGKHWFAEGWVRNAFDTDYVPIAISYAGLVPAGSSGFVGESGAPVTFGLKVGASF